MLRGRRSGMRLSGERTEHSPKESRWSARRSAGQWPPILPASTAAGRWCSSRRSCRSRTWRSRRFPWLPARYFVRHRFDNLSKLPLIHRPVFITHGTADRVIPFSQGERLFAAANEPEEFFAIPGNDHNDKLPDEMFDRLRRFVEAHP